MRRMSDDLAAACRRFLDAHFAWLRSGAQRGSVEWLRRVEAYALLVPKMDSLVHVHVVDGMALIHRRGDFEVRAAYLLPADPPDDWGPPTDAMVAARDQAIDDARAGRVEPMDDLMGDDA